MSQYCEYIVYRQGYTSKWAELGDAAEKISAKLTGDAVRVNLRADEVIHL